jgi:hypothetical protein
MHHLPTGDGGGNIAGAVYDEVGLCVEQMLSTVRLAKTI